MTSTTTIFPALTQPGRPQTQGCRPRRISPQQASARADCAGSSRLNVDYVVEHGLRLGPVRPFPATDFATAPHPAMVVL